jgi:hypothetical protein
MLRFRLQQHVLLPDIRAFMLPPESMASDGSIIQVRAPPVAHDYCGNKLCCGVMLVCRLRARVNCTRSSSAADRSERFAETRFQVNGSCAIYGESLLMTVVECAIYRHPFKKGCAQGLQ